MYFQKYIANKRHSYGIKIYLLTQTNGHCAKNAHIHRIPRSKVRKECGHAENDVKKLLLDFTGVGHIAFMDNFYTSVPIVKDLLDQNTYVTGTLRKSRVGNPQVMINANID